MTERIVDELRELAGVLDGTHRHSVAPSGRVDDVRLEGGQVLYWLALRCIREGLTWEVLRPDRALEPPQSGDVPSAAVVAALLRFQAESWNDGTESDPRLLAFESMRLVAHTSVLAGIDPVLLIRADLEELRTRPYLSEFFATWKRSPSG